MTLVDAGAVAGTFTELRLAAQARSRSESAWDTNLAEGGWLVTGLHLWAR